MKRITVTLDLPTYQGLARIAKTNKRGISPEVAVLVEQHVKTHKGKERAQSC